MHHQGRIYLAFNVPFQFFVGIPQGHGLIKTCSVMIHTCIIIIAQLVYHDHNKPLLATTMNITRKRKSAPQKQLDSISFSLRVKDSTVVKAQSLPLMWSGFDSQTQCHMWVEFVAQALVLASRCFSPILWFPPSPQKSTCPNSEFNLNSVPN